jgi:hypothetical protein
MLLLYIASPTGHVARGHERGEQHVTRAERRLKRPRARASAPCPCRPGIVLISVAIHSESVARARCGLSTSDR